MTFSGPKRLSWWMALLIWIGVILGIVGILAYLVPIPALFGISFWLLAGGFALLAIAAAIIYLRML